MLWNYNCIASDWKFIYDFSTVRTILVLFLKFNFCFSCNGFVYFCNSLCFSTSDCHYSSKHTISPNHVIHNVSDLLILFLTVSEINGEYRDMPLAYCGWLYQLTPSSLTIDCTMTVLTVLSSTYNFFLIWSHLSNCQEDTTCIIHVSLEKQLESPSEWT